MKAFSPGYIRKLKGQNSKTFKTTHSSVKYDVKGTLLLIKRQVPDNHIHIKINYRCEYKEGHYTSFQGQIDDIHHLCYDCLVLFIYFIYLGFYVSFNTVQVISRQVVGRGRGNQYIQFVRVLYCKLPTNGKQLPAFPLEAVPGTEPQPQRWEARVLPLCHRGPRLVLLNNTFKMYLDEIKRFPAPRKSHVTSW